MAGKQAASTRAANAVKAAQLMKMVASGAKVNEAAVKLKLTPSVAYRLFQREMKRVLDDHADVRERVFAQELENLRLLRAAIMPNALKGNSRAVEVAALVGRDYRSLLGMTEALKVEVSATRVDEVVNQIVEYVDGDEIASAEPLRRFTALRSERAV